MGEGATNGSLPVPYRAIGLLIEQRALTLFLGAAASLVGAGQGALPSGSQLSAALANLASYPLSQAGDSLTKVAQYLVEYAGDRDLILSYIKAQFHDKVPQTYRCAITDFLGEVPAQYMPKLIVSTNYDTLVERLLESRSIPYVCISHVLGRSKYAGRLIVYEKLDGFSRKSILTRAEADELLLQRLEGSSPRVILYKMHGSAISYAPKDKRDEALAGGLNSIVITEQDYIDYLDKNTMQRLPIELQRMLHNSQFLFLGYSLSDWNFRLLLHRLRESQAGAETKHYACLLQNDPVESIFWQKRGVNIHYVSLDLFLSNLRQHLEFAP
ncbi:SIR2 family protein [Bradyrhizobium sp. 21]|uniref:SIR2 family NAD-dependent protein deacylase n=1 Tax=Bradyrhizobium sp. 21 TaxID=2782666 RepID=UPI001FFABE04|nr:SIR2 family protein [Bradyrhizobium sp. 21]MCK1388872.1 SIR2 family protein [Bradyrhizobium sp. 21]